MSKPSNNRNGTINDIFPYQVCINLDRRPERWQQMERKFARHGIHSVSRFPAIDGDQIVLPVDWTHTPGAYGCLRSHIEVVRKARDLGVSSVLIFEDDVVFHDQFAAKFAAAIAELPSDWDMLFFGALHKEEPVQITPNLARITQANSTFACALSSTIFDRFIEFNSHSREVLDVNSLWFQQKFNCYCFMPHLAWVETNISDAQQRLVDHWYLSESLVVFGAEVDRLLTETTIVLAHGAHDNSPHDAENLMYLVRYFDHYFSPQVAMIIVEQGIQPSVDEKTLPANCKYLFVHDAGTFDRELCFATGIRNSEPNRSRFMLTDSNIYLETLHIRANLRFCERYDFVNGFQTLIDLDLQDSVRLRAAKSPQGIDFTKYGLPQNTHQSVCLFLNRHAIETGKSIAPRLTSGLHNNDRSFHSPNHALRLH